MTAPNDCAYGRAATTRSIDRFIFEVATISIVRVILRVFSTDLMRPFSSRPLAMIYSLIAVAGSGWRSEILLRNPLSGVGAEALLERFDAATQRILGVLGHILLRANRLGHLRELGLHELEELALPAPHRAHSHVVEEAV